MVFYGEIKCESVYKSGKNKGLRCKNGAYWDVNGSYLCGVHGRNKDKIALIKDKSVKLNKEKQHKLREVEIEESMKNNYNKGLKGNIKLHQLRMMKSIEYEKGLYYIFKI